MFYVDVFLFIPFAQVVVSGRQVVKVASVDAGEAEEPPEVDVGASEGARRSW